MQTRISAAARALFVSGVYIMIYVLMQVVTIIPALVSSNTQEAYLSKATGNLFLSMLAAMIVSMLLYIAFCLLRERPLSGELSFKGIAPVTVIDSVLAGLGLRGAVAVYTVFSENVPALRESYESANDISAASNTIPKLILGLMIINFFAPVFEEILFRGFVQTELMRAFPAGLSIFISSLLFSAVHWLLFQSLFAFFCGLVLGWCSYRTGSLLTGIVIHITFNASSILQFAVGILPWYILIIVFILSAVLVLSSMRSVAAACPARQ